MISTPSDHQLIQQLESSLYNSNDYAIANNKIADLINSDVRNIRLLNCIIELGLNRKNCRALSFIISELSPSAFSGAREHIDQIVNFDDSRVAYDLSRPVFLNLDNLEYARFFYKNMKNPHPFFSMGYLSLIPSLSKEKVKLLQAVVEEHLEKEILGLLLEKKGSDFFFKKMTDLESPFLKRLLARVAEKELDRQSMIKLIELTNDEEAYNGYYFQSKHSMLGDEC